MELGTILSRFKQSLDTIPESDARASIGPRAFITALVFSFLADRGARSLESIRRNVKKATGTDMARSSFWERMATRRLLYFLAQLAEEAIRNMAGVTFPATKIEALLILLQVKGILMVDSSSMSLPKMAGAVLPGPRKNVAPAVIKWHSCFDLLKGTVKWFDLSAGTSHDQNHFPDLNLLVGMLVIFDLGYCDYCLLQAIANVGGFFLCRVKTNAIVQIGEVVSGLPKKYRGKLLFGKHLSKGESIIEVKGLFKEGLFEWRVIGFWNPIDEVYHWYATNLLVPAKLIYPLYRLRWQAELLFKMAKSSLRLSEITSADANIVQSLVLASIVATTLANPLALVMARFNQLEKKQLQMPSLQRAGTVVVQMSRELMAFFLDGRRANLTLLTKQLKLFSNEIFDPNRKRETSIQRVFRMASEMA